MNRSEIRRSVVSDATNLDTVVIGPVIREDRPDEQQGQFQGLLFIHASDLFLVPENGLDMDRAEPNVRHVVVASGRANVSNEFARTTVGANDPLRFP